jgi:hypothetical protein
MSLLAVERFAAACERTRLATPWHKWIAGRIASNFIEYKTIADTDIYASGDETGTDYERE